MAELQGTSPDARGKRTLGRRGPLTIRIISLLDLLRRSGTLANKREFGLTMMEWRIMAQVGEHAPLTLNDLADLLLLDSGQTSRAVKAMAGRGLLSNKRKPGGAALMITLSEEGDALHARMAGLAAARNSFLTQDLAPDEVDQLVRLLDIVTGRAELLLDQERAASGPQAGED